MPKLPLLIFFLGYFNCRDWSDLVLEEIRRSLKHIHLGKERSREDEYGICMIILKTRAYWGFIAYLFKCSHSWLVESNRHIHCIGWLEFGGWAYCESYFPWEFLFLHLDFYLFCIVRMKWYSNPLGTIRVQVWGSLIYTFIMCL